MHRVSALAVATGQREGTVRLGLAWLAARGAIRVAEETGDVVLLMPGDGQPEAELQMLATSLEAALAETAAYRTYFRAAVATETLRINPDDADSGYNLGVVYAQQGRTDEAVREFQAALRIDPNGCRGALRPGRSLQSTGPH